MPTNTSSCPTWFRTFSNSIPAMIDNKTLIDLFIRRMLEEAGQKAKYKFAEAFKVLKLGYTEDVRKILESMSNK
ncbi:MAG TPA: hypothetical protein VMV49_11665 [Candidatus Deferrimicrobium sp.]|nr:hypothetical protein [Candidatus Deferrimicrobium sp.]